MLSLAGSELDHWIFEPKIDPRFESMNDNLRIVRPCLESVRPMFSNKAKSFDAPILAVVAR